jgi:hypothetical protein
MELISKKWKIAPEDGLTAADIMEMKFIGDQSVWAEFDVITSDPTGKTTFNTIHSARIDNKYYIIRTTINADFNLAPDVNIVERRLSVLDGIFENTDVLREEVPKHVTQGDIDAVTSFFTMVILDILGKQFKIKVDLPSLN